MRCTDDTRDVVNAGEPRNPRSVRAAAVSLLSQCPSVDCLEASNPGEHPRSPMAAIVATPAWRLVGVLCLAIGALSAAAPRIEGFPVRPADERARAVVHAALASPTVVRLIADLATTDVIVFVQVRMGLRHAGHLVFGARTPCFRLLVIQLSATQSPEDQVAVLAHELQHAREAAQSGVQDEAALARLMKRIGRRTDEGTFETQAAILVSREVTREVFRH